MAPLPLTLIVQTVLPWLGQPGRAAITALAANNGRLDSADRLAAQLGLRNRFCLARLLRREGLPPLSELADWIRALHLVLQAESTGQPLQRLAYRSLGEPANCYRLIRRRLGAPWSEVRARGLPWALIRFLERCRRPEHRPVGRADQGRPARLVARTSPAAGARPHPGAPAALPSRAAGHPVGRVAATLPIDGAPFDVAASPTGVMYVTCLRGAAVARVDLATRRVAAAIPVGSTPTRVVFDGLGRRAYVTNQFGETISVIDVAADRRIADIPMSGDPGALAVVRDANALYVSTNLDRLSAVSLTTNEIVASVPMPATPVHLAVHPQRLRLYVATWGIGTVIEIDVRTNAPLRSFAIGGQAETMVVAPDGSELYVTNDAGRLDVVDLGAGVVIASLALSARAFGLAVTPDGAQLYVGLVSGERVLVVDRATLRVLNTIPTGGTPRHIAFDPSGRTAVIANEAGWVTLVT
jgi:YVTN family beta-propeller protein